MSASIRCRRVGKVFLVLAVYLTTVGAVRGQQPRDKSDLLEQARRLREVAAQKLEAEVRDALQQAQALSATDPARAVALLRQMLAVVEQDTAISPERRDFLKRTLTQRLRGAETDAGRAGVKPEPPVRPGQDIGRRVEEQARLREQEQINQTLAQIRSLQGQGRMDEAGRLGRDLGRRFPDSPAAQAIARVGPAADRAVDLRNLRSEHERRMAGALGQVEASALPPIGDVEFPRDWQEKVKRTERLAVRMTPKERAIVDALNSPVSVSFKASRLEDVIKEMEKATGHDINILVDPQSLNEVQVTYETPVNLDLRKVTFRTALRKVLADLGLTFVVKDQVIQVMTPIRAKELMTVRSYYVGDLISVSGMILPPVLNQLQMGQTVAQIMDLIVSTIDPQSWAVNGGQGTIAFYPPTMSIVIKQSAELHFVLGGGLGSGR